jgi:hypothetical protein
MVCSKVGLYAFSIFPFCFFMCLLIQLRMLLTAIRTAHRGCHLHIPFAGGKKKHLVDLNWGNIQFMLSSTYVTGDLWPSASCPRPKTSALCDILITMKNDRRNILYFPPPFFLLLPAGIQGSSIPSQSSLRNGGWDDINWTGNSLYITVSPKVRQKFRQLQWWKLLRILRTVLFDWWKFPVEHLL